MITVAGEERINGGQARRYRYVTEDVTYAPTDPAQWRSGRQPLNDLVAAELRRRTRRSAAAE